MAHTSEERKTLIDVAPGRLAEVMYERLCGRSSIGPPIHRRAGAMPYKWLSDQIAKAPNNRRKEVVDILRTFLRELPDRQRWPEGALNNLFGLICECGHGVEADILELVQTKKIRLLRRMCG